MRRLLCLLVAAVLLVRSAPTLAQDKAPETKPPVPKRLVITIGSTVPLQMNSKRPIKLVVNERDDVLRITPVEGDPTTILLTGLKPGITRLTLTDVDGKKEIKQFGKPPAPPK